MKTNYKTYRTFLAILLLSVYLASPFKLYSPYISYKINYKYIANVLCENKEKPKMQCNGKCHLKKELKKAAEEESKNKNQANQSTQEELLVENSFSLAKAETPVEAKKHFLYIVKYVSTPMEHITPPPQV